MPRKGRGRTIYVRIKGKPQVERWLRDHCVTNVVDDGKVVYP